MKPLLLTLALAAGLAHVAPAAALGRMINLSVYDRTSQRTLPVFQHAGRYYIAGEPGHRYQVNLSNRRGDRVLTVLSVDAVNAISGENADWSQTGYVLSPFADTEVLGWRKSVSQVADFVFADFEQSYAVRTGRPNNVGVIGVAVFLSRPGPVEAPIADVARPMRVPPPPPQPRPLPMPAPPPAPAAPALETANMAAPPAPPSPAMAAKAAAAPAMAQQAARADAPLGTGHGEREYSSVNYVDFIRASDAPEEVITLYYDTWDHLVAKGVVPPRLPSRREPEAFPGRFVPDP